MNILRKTRQNKQKKSYKMPFARRGLAVFMSGVLLFLYIVPVEAGQIVLDENKATVTESLADEAEGSGERLVFGENIMPEERQGASINDEPQNEESEFENSEVAEELTESGDSEVTGEPAESEDSEIIEDTSESEEMQLPDGVHVSELPEGTEGTNPGVNGEISAEEEMPSDTLSEIETEEDAAEYQADLAAGERAVDVAFAGGDGTEENPYQVATAEQLGAVCYNTNAHYVQVADIDLSGRTWKTIGQFDGVYDGGGYKIFNMLIAPESVAIANHGGSWDTCYYGFIGFNCGTLQNVIIENCIVNLDMLEDIDLGVELGSYSAYVGGIAAYQWGGTVQDSSVQGNITIINSNSDTYIGGIIGYSYGGTNSECKNLTNNADINIIGAENQESVYCGGIMGNNLSPACNCINFGNINATAGIYLYCGGITGYIDSTLESCNNYGNINGTSNASKTGVVSGFGGNCNIGGIAGTTIYGVSINCINYGNVTASRNSDGICYAGGIIGFIGSSGGSFTNCYNFGKNITASEGVGRIAGRVRDGIRNCYSLDTTLVNGSIPTETGPDTQNGKSLTVAEVEALLNGETIPHPHPDSFSQDMVVPPDEYWILVMNETALPIPDAEINIDGEASYIYEDGIIKLKANNKSVWIVADREGKQPYFNYFTLQGGGAGYIKLLDSVPTLTATINNVILEEEQKSLLMNQFILYQGDPSAKPVYTLTIYWDGNEPDVYQLVQNGKVLEESHTNQITVDLMNRLTVDQDGVSVVLKKDGKVLCKKEINLKFRKEPEGKDGSKVEFGSKCKVSIDGTDIPFFDNTDLSFDTLVQLPVRIDVEENKAKIYIGDAYDLMKDGGNTFTYNDFVKKVEKEWRHAQIASTFKGGAVAGFKVSINFVGYGEGEVDPYTGVVQAKVGIYGKITGKNGITWYTFLGPVPFYAKVTGKVEDKISVETTLVIKNGKLLTSSVNMDNNLKLELGLGAGVGLNDLICADVSGKGILEWKTGGTLTTVDKNEITLKAEAAIRVVLLFLTYEKKWPSDSIQLYPITDTGSSWRIRRAKEYSSDIYEESAYQVLPRDYLLDSGARSVSFHSEGSTGAEDAGQVIINGLYPDAKPQLVSDGGKTYLFYLDDIVSRAAEDRTALMYRIQTGDTWSEPVIVQEDGTADFDFEACAGDDGIYIVWQNAVKSMSGITSLQEAASCLTLQTARIKEDNIVLLEKPDTTVGLMPVSPSLVCQNGNVYICWYENSQNDILQNANGKNVFYTQQMKGNIVGQRTVLGETEMSVTTADFGFYQNALSGAFTGDVDGDMNTVADREVYLLQNGSLQRLTHNDTIDSNPQFGILEGNQVMVYYADGNLVSVDGASARTIFGEADTTLSDDFYFTGEPAQPVIVWKNAYLAGEDAGQALTAVCYEDGEWKGPVEAVRSQDSLVAFSVCGKQSDRGFAQIVYTARERTDGPEITRLYETEAPKTGNASIAKMTYEEDSFLPGEIFPVEITLINNGVYPIQGVEICVVDETGAEIVRQKTEILLNAGDEGTIALTDFWPDDRGDLSEYTLQVYVDGRLCDTHTLTLGGASLSLDSKITYEEEDEILNLNVTNHSGLSADFRLIIQAEGDVLFEKEYTAVPGKSSVNYFCKLDTLWRQTQKDSLSVTVESTSRQEECLLDNEIIIYRPNRTEPITVELEQRELQLQPGESLQLTALFPSYVQNKALIWSSNYSECVEVDSNGVVTAKTDGIAMVTATTCDGYTSSCVITVGEPDVQLFSIAGKIQSHGESQDKAVVRLLRGTDEISRQETATGEYILTDVEPGSYTLQISKAGHVTREYQAESVSLDIRIHLIGDVNGDGKVNVMDKRIIFNHIAGTKLTGYEFQVGDVNGDGTINIMDKRMIFNHIAGTGLLW